jgi:hypothetical protein
LQSIALDFFNSNNSTLTFSFVFSSPGLVPLSQGLRRLHLF